LVETGEERRPLLVRMMKKRPLWRLLRAAQTAEGVAELSGVGVEGDGSVESLGDSGIWL
jgi:hypothetical protein